MTAAATGFTSPQRIPAEEIHDDGAGVERGRRRCVLDRVGVRDGRGPLMVDMIPAIHELHQILAIPGSVPVHGGIIPCMRKAPGISRGVPEPVARGPRGDEVRDIRQTLAGARAAAIRDRDVGAAVEGEDGDVFPRGPAVGFEGERRALGARDVDIVGAGHGREGGDSRRRSRVAREVVRHQAALRLARGVDAGGVDAEPGLHGVQDLQDVRDIVDDWGDLRRALPIAAPGLAVFPRGRVHEDVVGVEERGGQEVEVGLRVGRPRGPVKREDQGRGFPRVVIRRYPEQKGPPVWKRCVDPLVEADARFPATSARAVYGRSEAYGRC